VATAWVETLEILYRLYKFSYRTGDMSDLNCWETGEDEISESQALAEEVTDEFGGHPGLSDGDGFPDLSTICQRLFDKVRSISLNPLQATDAKKRTLRIYCRTLWQHMWSYEPLQGIGDEFIPPGWPGWQHGHDGLGLRKHALMSLYLASPLSNIIIANYKRLIILQRETKFLTSYIMLRSLSLNCLFQML
jgi:hypothetical protein